MILRALVIAIWLAAFGSQGMLAQGLVPPATQTDDAVWQELGRSLQISELVAHIRQEGLDSAETLAADFGIERPRALLDQFEHLFDQAAMEQLLLAELRRELQDDGPVRMAAVQFFSSVLGQRVLAAEMAARSEIEDAAIKAAVSARYDRMAKEDPERRGLIDGMIRQGDLVEYNVTGGLNSNFAMMRGLAQTGALGDLPESEMLAMVWGDEQEIRDSTGEWLTLLMTQAYRDLSLDELQTYRDFMTSPEGRKLNSALFAGFDTMYRGLSEQQGRVLGQLMQGNDI